MLFHLHTTKINVAYPTKPNNKVGKSGLRTTYAAEVRSSHDTCLTTIIVLTGAFQSQKEVP
jgi:hypothetical protein